MSAPTAQVDFIVPTGYVLVPRRIHHWFEPGFGVKRSDVSMDLLINFGVVQNNTGIFVGPASDNIVNFFEPVDENSTFSVRLNAFSNGGVFPTNLNVFVHVYGNFIVKTGVALPYEIANPGQSRKIDARGPRVANPAPLQNDFAQSSPPAVSPIPQAFVPMASQPAPQAVRIKPRGVQYPPDWASMSGNAQFFWLRNHGLIA
jgi:hypothetical protein